MLRCTVCAGPLRPDYKSTPEMYGLMVRREYTCEHGHVFESVEFPASVYRKSNIKSKVLAQIFEVMNRVKSKLAQAETR